MIRLEINENFLKTLEYTTYLLLVTLALVYYLLSGSLVDLFSVLIGGLLAVLNFRSAKKDVRSILKEVATRRPAPRRSRSYLFQYLLKYYLRLIATAFVLFFVIKVRIVHPLPLLVGISVVIVNILLCFFREVGRNFWLKFKEG